MYSDKLKNIQILELIQQLSDKEINDFSKFMRIKGISIEYLDCLQLICKPKIKDPEELKIKIHQQIYPTISYKDVRIRLLFSDLMKELRLFIIQKLSYSELDSELTLLQFYRRRRIDRIFDNHSENLTEKLRTHSNWDEKKYYNIYILEFEKLKHETSKNRYNPTNFSEVLQNFELHVIIERLRLYLEHLTFRQFGSELNTYPELEFNIAQVMKKEWTLVPEINLYLRAVKLFTDPENVENYEKFIEQLFTISSTIEIETKKELFSHALNFCIRKINKDFEAFFGKTLDLYDHGVKDLWILDHGVMNQVTYKNIISLCIRMGNFSLAEEKLNQYKEFVNKKDRESIYQFNKARILKEKGQTREALILLYSNRYKDSLIEIHARIEMIKIYYELQEESLLNNQILSTEKFINKSQQLGYHKKYYLNFCKYTSKLNQYRKQTSKSKSRIELYNKIVKETEVLERSWLVKEAHLISNVYR